jgi:hypothetical protein
MAQISWKAAQTGNWSDGANWSSGTTPTASDNVTIDLSGGYGVLLTTAVVADNISFSAPFATLAESASGSFTIADPTGQLFVFNGFVVLNGANNFGNALDLGGVGVLKVGNSHALGDSTLYGSGGQLIGTAAVTLPNAMNFYIGVTTVSAASAPLTVAGAGQIDPGATLVIGASSPALFDGPVVWTGNFQNDGFLQIAVGSLQFTRGAGGFVNTGIVEGDKRTNPDNSITWTPDNASFPTFYGGSGDNVFALSIAPGFVDGGGGTDTIDVRANMTFSAGSVVNVETFEIENGVAANLSALTADETIVFNTPAGGSASVKGGAGVDTVVFREALAAATIVHNADGTVTIATTSGGRDTLSGVEWAQFADQRVSLASVVTPPPAPVQNLDFNGDSKADLLWRNASGETAIWNSNSSGGFSGQDLGDVGDSWQVGGAGYFNGDAKADILWSNASGDAAIWNSNGAGGFTGQDLGTTGSGWQVAGVGDFTGDGASGILWSNASGDTSIWKPNGSGGFTGQDLGTAGSGWQVAGVGDFNGDGEADILWSNASGDSAIWNSNGAGGFAGQDLKTGGSGWQVAGIGDFNGDGNADILWSNASGDASIWNSNGAGGFTGQDLGTAGSGWRVAALGDYNGDGKSDILWSKASGDTALWNSNGAGGFSGQNLGVVAGGWTIQNA